MFPKLQIDRRKTRRALFSRDDLQINLHSALDWFRAEEGVEKINNLLSEGRNLQ